MSHNKGKIYLCPFLERKAVNTFFGTKAEMLLSRTTFCIWIQKFFPTIPKRLAQGSKRQLVMMLYLTLCPSSFYANSNLSKMKVVCKLCVQWFSWTCQQLFCQKQKFKQVFPPYISKHCLAKIVKASKLIYWLRI